MCRLTNKVFETEDDFDDALVIQPKSESGKADYNKASGIIRRVENEQETRWLFDALIPDSMAMVASSSPLGKLPEAVRSAYYHLGINLDDFDFIKVRYTDSDFPHNLIPH